MRINFLVFPLQFIIFKSILVCKIDVNMGSMNKNCNSTPNTYQLLVRSVNLVTNSVFIFKALEIRSNDIIKMSD